MLKLICVFFWFVYVIGSFLMSQYPAQFSLKKRKRDALKKSRTKIAVFI